MIRVESIKGNIFDVEADAIVIPVNHKGIPENGLGAQFDEQYPNHLHHKPLRTSYVEVLGGVAKWKKIIVVVVPTWYNNDDNKMKLIQSYRSILGKALKEQVKSIAIPLLGAGFNYWPCKEASSVRDETVEEWGKRHSESELSIIMVTYPEQESEEKQEEPEDLDGRLTREIKECKARHKEQNEPVPSDDICRAEIWKAYITSNNNEKKVNWTSDFSRALLNRIRNKKNIQCRLQKRTAVKLALALGLEEKERAFFVFCASDKKYPTEGVETSIENSYKDYIGGKEFTGENILTYFYCVLPDEKVAEQEYLGIRDKEELQGQKGDNQEEKKNKRERE